MIKKYMRLWKARRVFYKRADSVRAQADLKKSEAQLTEKTNDRIFLYWMATDLYCRSVRWYSKSTGCYLTLTIIHTGMIAVFLMICIILRYIH